MDEQAQTTAQTQAGADGGWQIGVDTAKLTPGLHEVMVEGADGQPTSVFFFVEDQTRVQTVTETQVVPGTQTQLLLERVRAVIPHTFGYAAFFLFFIIAALAMYTFRLGRALDRDEHDVQHHHAKRAALVALIGCVAALLVGGAMVLRTVHPEQAGVPATHQVALTISGSVLSPFDRTPIEGVDLVAGDTRVRTDASGAYLFNEIDPDQGIRLTHPSLTRALRFRFGEIASSNASRVTMDPSDILFDAGLYNALIAATDLEARERYEDLLALVSRDTASRLNVEALAADRRGKSPFNRDDIGAQELVVEHLEADPERSQVSLVVSQRGRQATYLLVFEDGAWRLVY